MSFSFDTELFPNLSPLKQAPRSEFLGMWTLESDSQTNVQKNELWSLLWIPGPHPQKFLFHKSAVE